MLALVKVFLAVGLPGTGRMSYYSRAAAGFWVVVLGRVEGTIHGFWSGDSMPTPRPSRLDAEPSRSYMPIADRARSGHMIRRHRCRGSCDGRVRKGEGGADGARGGTRRKMSIDRKHGHPTCIRIREYFSYRTYQALMRPVRMTWRFVGGVRLPTRWLAFTVSHACDSEAGNSPDPPLNVSKAGCHRAPLGLTEFWVPIFKSTLEVVQIGRSQATITNST